MREIKRCADGITAIVRENGKTIAVVQLCGACGRWKNPNERGNRYAPSGKMKCRKCCKENRPFTVSFLKKKSVNGS